MLVFLNQHMIKKHTIASHKITYTRPRLGMSIKVSALIVFSLLYSKSLEKKEIINVSNFLIKLFKQLFEYVFKLEMFFLRPPKCSNRILCSI